MGRFFFHGLALSAALSASGASAQKPICNQGEAGLGEPYWYPYIDMHGDSACVKNSNYPPEYYTLKGNCEIFLFHDKVHCCNAFPEACKGDANEEAFLGAMSEAATYEHPSSSTNNGASSGSGSSSTNQQTGEEHHQKVEIHSNNVHVNNAKTTPATNKETVCALGKQGEGKPYWYPHINPATQTGTCVKNDNYPEEYYSNKDMCELFLYNSKAECCKWYPNACPKDSSTTTGKHSTDIDLASIAKEVLGDDVTTLTSNIETVCKLGKEGEGKPYWYPHVDGKGKGTCVKNANYPNEYYSNTDLCELFLYNTKAECCMWYPDACPKDASKTTGKHTGIGIETVVEANNDLQAGTTTTQHDHTATSLTSNIKAVCSQGKAGQGKAYWYPHVDTKGKGTCVKNASYPDNYYSNTDLCELFLYSTKAECCLWYPDACPKNDASSSTATTTHTSSGGTGSSSSHTAGTSTGGGTHTATHTSVSTTNLQNSGSGVCAQGQEGAGKAYWYPRINTSTGEGVCVNDANYPTEFYTDKDLCYMFLYHTKTGCCLEFPDACPSDSTSATAGKNPGSSSYADKNSSSSSHGNDQGKDNLEEQLNELKEEEEATLQEIEIVFLALLILGTFMFFCLCVTCVRMGKKEKKDMQEKNSAPSTGLTMPRKSFEDEGNFVESENKLHDVELC